MTSYRRIRLASTITLAMMLAACGGGGSETALVVTPPPVAPPPAPPPPVLPSKYSGPIALQSPQPFATAGYATRYSVDVAGTNAQLLSGPSASDTIAFRQLPGANQYELSLPGYQTGLLSPIYHNGTVCSDSTVCNPSSITHKVTVGATATLQDALVTIPIPGSSYPDPTLTYTSLASWTGQSSDPANPAREFRTEGVFAYGIPTAAGDVPTSGTGSYSATISGLTKELGNYVGGGASLTFNFAAGTLSGEMRPEISDGWDLQSLGVYPFSQTVFGVGSTTYSGQFSGPGSGGFFEGQFTGPQAAELLARWQAPYTFGQTSGTMFGVWVGKQR